MRILHKKSNKDKPYRRTVALFGGAFNPPHQGHVAIVKALLRRKEIDQVWIVPVYRHPFRKKIAPYSARFHMCRLAFSSFPRVTIKRVEEKLGGTSYTVWTLRSLTKRYPGTRFLLVVGTDSYRARSKWKDFDKIKGMADLIVFPRGKHSPVPVISSTEIRKKHGNTETLHPKIYSYIRDHKLYGS